MNIYLKSPLDHELAFRLGIGHINGRVIDLKKLLPLVGDIVLYKKKVGVVRFIKDDTLLVSSDSGHKAKDTLNLADVKRVILRNNCYFPEIEVRDAWNITRRD
jgi:predicted ABC-type sugar transport system permease subunit